MGTNNCRLLVARPTADGFRVVDAFSRIVRLGEGLSQTGRLSEAAIARTLEALRICRDKMAARGVSRARLIATEACRAAENGAEFLAEVRERLGMELEVVDRETEAPSPSPAAATWPIATPIRLLFDIGGGSSEIIWLDRSRRDLSPVGRIEAWESLRIGVVSLAETFGGGDVTPEIFAAMARCVGEALTPFVSASPAESRCAFHFLGTSGRYHHAGVHLVWPVTTAARSTGSGSPAPKSTPRWRGSRARATPSAPPTAASASTAPTSFWRAARSSRRSAAIFPPSGCASPTAACARAS